MFEQEGPKGLYMNKNNKWTLNSWKEGFVTWSSHISNKTIKENGKTHYFFDVLVITAANSLIYSWLRAKEKRKYDKSVNLGRKSKAIYFSDGKYNLVWDFNETEPLYLAPNITKFFIYLSKLFYDIKYLSILCNNI